MEWKKAKNYTIIFLLVINCLFFVLNVIKKNDTRLSSEDVHTVSKVLKSRGITLNCQLPEDYSDMGQLNMRAYEYDNIVLQEIFFDKISGVRRTEEGGDTVFIGEDGKLTVSDERVSFQGYADEAVTDEASAEKVAQKYVNGLNGKFTDYRERIGGATDDGYFFEYRQSFHNRLVFSNYLKAWIGNDGSVELIFNYQQPVEYKGSKEDIISAAEAVYAASKVIAADFTATTVDVVEKGYYLSERRGADELTAVPEYKIYVDGGVTAYYVNAYSGDVVRD
jgi:hypothetical protein